MDEPPAADIRVRAHPPGPELSPILLFFGHPRNYNQAPGLSVLSWSRRAEGAICLNSFPRDSSCFLSFPCTFCRSSATVTARGCATPNTRRVVRANSSSVATASRTSSNVAFSAL